MTKYRAVYINQEGQRASSILNAKDESTAKQNLRRRGLKPIQIEINLIELQPDNNKSKEEYDKEKYDDKKLQKLLDIFIEPKLTTDEIEEDKRTKEKNLKTNERKARERVGAREEDEGGGAKKVRKSARGLVRCNHKSSER